MTKIALATSIVDLPNDDDMPLLQGACAAIGVDAEVCAWDDPGIDWSRYDHVILRSTWNYIECRSEFLSWCDRVALVAQLINAPAVARWATCKRYLDDLAALGVPVVPSRFVRPGADPRSAIDDFLGSAPDIAEFVVKPTIGSRSKDVRRYKSFELADAVRHVASLLDLRNEVILQPYFSSVDSNGETNLIYFDRRYSHAIRKSALLLEDGTVRGPWAEFRALRVADNDEQEVALAALDAAAVHLRLDRPLLYGRVDLIRDAAGKPRVLELDICEPSLSLPFAEGAALRFARAIASLPPSSTDGGRV